MLFLEVLVKDVEFTGLESTRAPKLPSSTVRAAAQLRRFFFDDCQVSQHPRCIHAISFGATGRSGMFRSPVGNWHAADICFVRSAVGIWLKKLKLKLKLKLKKLSRCLTGTDRDRRPASRNPTLGFQSATRGESSRRSTHARRTFGKPGVNPRRLRHIAMRRRSSFRDWRASSSVPKNRWSSSRPRSISPKRLETSWRAFLLCDGSSIAPQSQPQKKSARHVTSTGR
jgi:hypothetical protein